MRVVLVLTMALGLATESCLGALAVDEISPNRDGRQGMSVVAQNDLFILHAHPSSVAAARAGADLGWLTTVHGLYAGLMGGLSDRVANVFFHPENALDGYVSFAGIAWCDDFSFDLEWLDEDPPWQDLGDASRQHVEAHEAAHLAMCDRFGAPAAARPFLSEGMAVYLEAYTRTNPPRTPASLIPNIDALSACDDWSLRDLFAGARFWSARHPGYPASGLFTALAVERLGLHRYMRELYLPSVHGTTSEAEDRLRELLGRSFADMESEMRLAVSAAVPKYCSPKYRCGARCTCRLRPGSTWDGDCVPAGSGP